MLASDEDKLRAYRDPEVRRKLHQEVGEWTADLPGANVGRRWYDYIWVGETVLPKHKAWQGKSIREMAEAQGKGIIDGFLDLVVEENLDTVFLEGSSNVDKAAMAQILNYPNAYIGLSDGGAHVQFHGGYGYSTRLLGYWVRQEGIMSLEQAVRRLTFESASTFGIYDRGLLRLAWRPTSRSLMQTPSARYPRTRCMIFRLVDGAFGARRWHQVHHCQRPGAARRRTPYRGASRTRAQE